MRLMIGGSWQGKLETARRLWGFSPEKVTDGASCGPEQLERAAVLNHFHELVKRSLTEDSDITPENIDAFVDQAAAPGKDLIILCDELGCGVVPYDRNDRAWREKTGRLLCLLAAGADEVYRVTAGIAVRIK